VTPGIAPGPEQCVYARRARTRGAGGLPGVPRCGGLRSVPAPTAPSAFPWDRGLPEGRGLPSHTPGTWRGKSQHSPAPGARPATHTATGGSGCSLRRDTPGPHPSLPRRIFGRFSQKAAKPENAGIVWLTQTFPERGRARRRQRLKRSQPRSVQPVSPPSLLRPFLKTSVNPLTSSVRHQA